MSRSNIFFTLDLLVLSVLSRGDNYGYGIATIINEESEGKFTLKEGVLYPILYKLSEAGFISSYDLAVNRRMRVYYRIEDEGIAELKQQLNDFYDSYHAIERIIKNKDD